MPPAPPPPSAPSTSLEPLEDAATRRRLVELAAAIGFDGLAIAEVSTLPAPHPAAYREFLQTGAAGDMRYLHDAPEVRVDPTARWPWARSVLVLAVQYDRGRPVTTAEYATGYMHAPRQLSASGFPVASTPATAAPVPTVAQTVARYAQGRDYHRLIENALRLFKDAIVSTPELGIAQTYFHCDTGPVLERPWGQLAGLGWQAKNGLLIRPGAGSFCFLAELFIDRVLPADTPASDHCGSCTRCIDACPTDAIIRERVVDPRRCIPWMNIERREPLPPAVAQTDLHGWLFGCDICQNVCPHNTKIGLSAELQPAPDELPAWPTQFTHLPLDGPVALPWYRNPDRPLRRVLHPDLWRIAPALENLTWSQAAALSEVEFDQLKQGTALRRVPYRNFLVNLQAVKTFWETSNTNETD